MTVGTACAEGANRTYVNLTKIAGPVPRRNARNDRGIIDYPVNLGQELNIACRHEIPPWSGGHWQRGEFPRSFLARTNENTFAWREQVIQTFLERDVPLLGIDALAGATIDALFPKKHRARPAPKVV